MANFRTAERTKNVLSAAERLSIGNLTLAGRRRGRSGDRRVERHAGQYRGDAAQRPHHLAQIEQIQVIARRDLAHAPGSRRALRRQRRGDGDSFGTLIPHVGGQRRDWNKVMVDGVVGNEVGASNLIAQPINLDAIAEVKILLNTYRAEYGRAGGGQVQIVRRAVARNTAATCTTTAATRSSMRKTSSSIGRTSRTRVIGSIPTGQTLAVRCPRARSSSSSIRWRRRCVSRPGPLRNWTMPTDGGAERATSRRRWTGRATHQHQGSAARRGVRSHAPRARMLPRKTSSRPTHQANGLALLNMLPGGTNFDRGFTQGQYNHRRRKSRKTPDEQHGPRRLAAVERTIASTSRSRTGTRTSEGSEITAGPAAWGFFKAHYLNTDRGGSANYTKILRSNLIWTTTPARGSRPSSSIR